MGASPARAKAPPIFNHVPVAATGGMASGSAIQGSYSWLDPYEVQLAPRVWVRVTDGEIVIHTVGSNATTNETPLTLGTSGFSTVPETLLLGFSLATGTWGQIETGPEVDDLLPIMVSVIGSEPEADLLEAAESLRALLGISVRQLARVAGWKSPSNLYHYRHRREAGHPVQSRDVTGRQLLAALALVEAIDTSLASDPAAPDLRAWLKSVQADGEVAWDLLLAGRVREVSRLAEPLLFGTVDAQSGRRKYFVDPAETSMSTDEEAWDGQFETTAVLIDDGFE